MDCGDDHTPREFIVTAVLLFPLQLALKTVNSARSAYASFLFCRSFFHSYSDGRPTQDSEGYGEEMEDEEDTNKCKITIKVS